MAASSSAAFRRFSSTWKKERSSALPWSPSIPFQRRRRRGFCATSPCFTNQSSLSWGVGGTANRAELALFLDELSRALPLPQVEIVVEVDNLLASGAMDNCLGLFDGLSGKGVRRGLLHANQFGFVLDELRPSVADELCASIDMLKLRRVAIVEMKDDIGLASLGHSFIESLNAQAVDIVADELYNRSDVALAILLGIRYGQGFFLSRNETQQKIGKAMRKQPGADFFERRFEPSFCY